mmetsp:Transcript_1793/g.5224  ORF Transcript_1793/g.5224 Transcript_1793/m.5224 type:complete len:1062 (-) Transcript_1793:74-3259(-)
MEAVASLHLALQDTLTFSDGGPDSSDGDPTAFREPDFIASAEEMKKIFQVSYRDQELSVLVHRVGSTLHLGGDFDVSWLMDPDQDGSRGGEKPTGQRRPPGNVRRERQRQKKRAAQGAGTPGPFMYYSVPKENGGDGDGETIRGGEAGSSEEGSDDDAVLQGAELREFRASLKRDKTPNKTQDIKHVFRWKFNDIAMLLGSDSIILGSSQDRETVRMCMRDIEEQISSAACLDLWLDNLMAGAEELALCYHKEGVMQGYQLLKTKDIPNVAHCQHLATTCHDSAAQLLSMLKDKCTADGASYVVQKAPGSQEVQIYQLKRAESPADEQHRGQSHGEDTNGASPPTPSALASGAKAMDSAATHRPFSYPMAVLCYRMAMRLLEMTSGKAGISQAQRLLSHCISLLDESQHPRLWASAHMHLADVVVLFERINMSGKGQQSEEPPGREAAGASGPIMLRQVQDAGLVPAYIISLVYAADYLGMGISCLTFYEPEALSLIGRMHVKAGNTLTTLAEECCRNALSGKAFRVIRFAACNITSAIEIGAKDATTNWERQLTRRLLSASGDAHRCLARLQAHNLRDPARVSQTMYFHTQELNGLSPGSVVAHNGEDCETASGSFPVVKKLSSDRELNLTYAVQRYLGSLKLYKDQDNAEAEYNEGVKAMGEVYIELGHILKDSGRFTKAYQHYRQGVQLFQSVGADLCVANSHIELARLAAAQAKAVDPSMDTLGELQRLTTRCIESFKTAIDLLGSKRSNSELWIRTKIELSDVLVSSAGYLQAVLALSKDPEELGNIVVGMYRDALKSYSDVTTLLSASAEVSHGSESDSQGLPLLGGSRLSPNMTVDNLTWVANAAASVHHQAARLHGQLARLAVTAANIPADTKEARRARLLSLALSHIDKGIQVFNINNMPVRYLRLQLDGAALLRQLLPPRGVVRVLETALERLLGVADVFDSVHYCNCEAGTCACGATAAEAAATDFKCAPGSYMPGCPASVWRDLEVEINLLLREIIQARTAAPGRHGRERLEGFKSMYRTSLTQREHCNPEQMLQLLGEQFVSMRARAA